MVWMHGVDKKDNRTKLEVLGQSVLFRKRSQVGPSPFTCSLVLCTNFYYFITQPENIVLSATGHIKLVDWGESWDRAD